MCTADAFNAWVEDAMQLTNFVSGWPDYCKCAKIDSRHLLLNLMKEKIYIIISDKYLFNKNLLNCGIGFAFGIQQHSLII